MRAAPQHLKLVCMGLFLLGSGVGCATIGEPRPPAFMASAVDIEWPKDSAAYAGLLALRDAEHPAPEPLPVPRLRGLDTERLVSIAPDDPATARAHLPLAEALAALRQFDPNPAAEPPLDPPTEGALLRAQRLYVSGVSKLLAGESAAAARDLAAAAQLDPTAPSPWLRLAEAQAQMGQNSASLLSRKKAADLGANNAISLAILGIQATRTGQHKLAAHYLARCLEAEPQRVDPLLRQVALVRIASPLRELGYLHASITALEEGLILPRRLTAPTRFGAEASDIARRASDFWRQIGDTACRLGDDDLAARAYATAAGAPSADPGAILTRRAFVLLRSGRRASVGLLVLDTIAQHGGRADEREFRLLALLATDREVGPLVAGALADLAASLPEPRTASTETALVLAKAAVASPREAESLLRARALASPGDRRVIEALFALPGDDTSREALALQLVQETPAAAERITGSLLAWHSRPAALLESLPDSPAGRLVRVHVLQSFGRTKEAAGEPLPESPATTPLALALTETIGLAAATAGAWDVVDRALDSLAEHPIAAARLCRGAQRYAQGLAHLAPVLDEEPDLPTLLLAAELSLAVGELEEAKETLDRAVALDPFDARPYEGLINVYQTMGEQQRAGETLRELRSRVPSSHLLRWINAQEEARRGLLEQAEQSLQELAEDAPDNGNAFGMLLQIWAQRARAHEAEAEKDTEPTSPRLSDDNPRPDGLDDAARFLARLAENPPISPELLAARGRLLGMMGREEEAERTLRAGLSSWPAPMISRSLEEVLRQTGRADEAEALAAARFAANGRGIDACLEYAEILARADRWQEVTPLVRDALPAGAQLTASQRSRVFSLITALASRTAQSPTPSTARTDAVALFALVQQRGIDLPWPAHYSLWALTSTDPETTDAQIAEATDALLAAIDSLDLAHSIIGDNASRLLIPIETLDQARGQVAYQLAGSLYASGREEAALALYRKALQLSPDHPWAANDLGYFLLERHEHLDEA
ncbi:hypothetical protein MNBD_PLANCTO03-46, partial [hydrothermal vent metagenome]